MAPPYWANEAQRTWLHGWMPDFVRRQAEKKLHLFWPTLYAAWFEQFPEHTALKLPLPKAEGARELTPDELATLVAAILARKNYRYQRKKIAKGGGVVAAVQMSTLLDSLFDMRTKTKGRVHQAIEIFQKRNRDVIKAALEAASYDKLDARDEEDDWTDEADGSEAAKIKSTKSDRMRTRTRVVMALWQAASPEEKEAVYAEVEKEKEEQRATDLKEESDNAPRTPAQLQDAIDVVDTFFVKAHAAVQKSTEWVGLSIVGGCNPRLGGNLSMKIICNGATPGGNDFEDFYDEFQNVVQVFERFLQLVFSPEHCKSRALDGKAASTSDPTRPVTVIPAPAPTAPAPLTEPAKKKKKRTKTKSPAVVEEPIQGTDPVQAQAQPAAATNLVQLDNADEGLFSTAGDLVNVQLDDLRVRAITPSPTLSPNATSPWNDETQDGDTSFFDNGDQATHNNLSWSLGMPPPLSPRSAGAIAERERGGAPGDGPTMAVIDPELMALSVSPSPTSVSERPKPKAAFRGAAARAGPESTVTESAASAFRLSPLFDALRPTSAPRTPLIFGASPASTPGYTSPFAFTFKPALKMPVAAKPAGGPTTAARTLSMIIGAKPTTAAVAAHPSPPAVAPPPLPVAPAAHSSSPIAAAAAIMAPVPPPVATGPAFAGAPAPPPVAAAPIVAARSSPPVLTAPPITTAPPLPAAPAVPAAPALMTAPTNLDDLELPECRPVAKPPIKETVRKGRKPPGPKRKSGTKKVANKKAAASQAQAVASVTAGAKKRGRPPKAAAAAASGEPLDDVSNLPTAETGTIVFCTKVGNNRASARKAAQQEKANQAKATEDARKAQVAKGWLPGPEGSVTFLPPRVKKPTRNWEGAEFVLPKVNTRPRAPQLDASEKALLARAAAAKATRTSTKRKTPLQRTRPAPTKSRRRRLERCQRGLLNQPPSLLNQLKRTAAQPALTAAAQRRLIFMTLDLDGPFICYLLVHNVVLRRIISCNTS
ncbi:hypothetical protein K438DRAFT_1769085 [Mycena galopus ATCC 62051]|nr:hypothetical protein K438DRAFT_1769085 [Mycena galopus ATCC 62051]